MSLSSRADDLRPIVSPVSTSAVLRLTRSSRFDAIAAAAISALGFAFMLPALGYRALWGDEAFSAGLARQPWDVFMGYLWGQETNSALYFLGLRGWIALLDVAHIHESELVLRVPSALAAAAATGVVYLIGRRLAGRLTALVASVLYLLNYLQLYQSLDVRGYGFEMLLTSVGWYALLRWHERLAGGRWKVAYVVSMALAVYFHYYAIVVLAAQLTAFGLIAWFAGGDRFASLKRELRRMIGAALAVAALAAPTLVDAGIHGGPNHEWVPPAHLLSFGALARDIVGYSPLYFLAASLAGLWGILSLWRRRGEAPGSRPVAALAPSVRDPRSILILLACWFVVPPLATFAVTQPFLNLHLFSPVYLVVVVPGVCLLIAIGALAVPRPRLRMAAAILIVGCAATAVPNYYASAPRVDNIQLINWVQAHRVAGDGVVTTSNKSAVVLDYYFGPRSSMPYFTDDYPGRLSWPGKHMDTASLSDSGIAAYAGLHPRVFFIADTPLFTSDLDPTARSVQHSLDSHYRLLEAATWQTQLGSEVVVRLYQTSPLPG